MSKIYFNKIIKFIILVLWYLFVAYTIAQAAILIWLSSYIDEVKNALLFLFLGLFLGVMIGYVKGTEDTAIEKGLFDE